MSLHLFSQPVQCTNCGTVVDDPTVDRCPNCQTLLLERRTPSRIAGVERRYGGVRVLLGILRFLGVITLLVGILLGLFSLGSDEISAVGKLLILLGSLVLAAAIFAVAAVFDILIDIEENTRASFRLVQKQMERDPGRASPL